MRLLFVAQLVLFAACLPAQAQDLSLKIKDHRFEPAELEVPAGKELHFERF
jgi:Cupredoxin-like domain